MKVGAGRKLTLDEQELIKKRDELNILLKQFAQREQIIAKLRGKVHNFRKIYAQLLAPLIEELDALKRIYAEILAGQNLNKAEQARPGEGHGHHANEEELEGIEEDFDWTTNTGPANNIKELYRRVAKTIHPDLSTDDEERKWRQKLMAEANNAYAQEDGESLEAILREWENSPKSFRSGGASAELGLVLHKIFLVKEKIRTVEGELVRLKDSDIYRLMARVERARFEGIDLLAEMAAKMNKDIVLARRKLKELSLSPGTGSDQTLRTVSFPSSYSIGMLFVRKRSSISFLDWQPYGEAIGKVAVPDDKSLRLDVREGFAGALSPLHKLDADDLQALFLRGTKDSELHNLRGLTGLRELYLSGKGVTDKGLVNLRVLNNLLRLYLYETVVTDSGVELLNGMSGLQSLTFSDTIVTEAGLNRLRKTMPSCRIIILQNRGKG